MITERNIKENSIHYLDFPESELYCSKEEFLEHFVLLDTGLSTDTFIALIDGLVRPGWQVNVHREFGRLHDVSLSLRPVALAYYKHPYSVWKDMKGFAMNAKDREFVIQKVAQAKRAITGDTNAYEEIIWNEPDYARRCVHAFEVLKLQKKDYVIADAYRELSE